MLIRMRAAYDDGRHVLARDEETDQLPDKLALKLCNTRPPLADLVDDAKPSISWLRKELVAYADRIGATFESDDNKPSILAAIDKRQAQLNSMATDFLAAAPAGDVIATEFPADALNSVVDATDPVDAED